MPIYISGLDLGQTTDPTAFAVLEQSEDVNPIYSVRHLERFRLGTNYVEIAQQVTDRFRGTPLANSALAVDQTGVGRAVVDLIRHDPNPAWTLYPITITAGNSATRTEDGSRHVPKKDLVGALQVLLQTGRLKIAASLPDAKTLVKELANFKVKITAAANEVFEAWRDGDHDDLVLATAMAAWVGQNCCLGAWDPTPTPGTERSSIMSQAPKEFWELPDQRKQW